ncbi:MAG: hypothetical protein AAGD28_13705 [Bacteroidota bacterium]
MKKLMSACCVFLFLSFTAFAQTAEVSKTAAKTEKTTCKPVPPEVCAAKLGISLEEYQKRNKNCKTSASASVETTALPIVRVANSASCTKANKKCCASLEECAKKMGMSVEECKAKCGSKVAIKDEKASAEIAESQQ